MGSAFDSFDESPFGVFVESTLKARGAGAGLIVFHGQDNASNNLASCVGYLPDSWTTLATASTFRRAISSSSIDGIIYSYSGIAVSETQSNEAYDVASNSWTTKAATPSPARSTAAGGPLGGYAYLFGGNSGGFRIADNDKYWPATDSWSASTDLPTPARSGHTAELIDDRIYAFGGYDGTYLQDVDYWNGASWYADTSLPAPARTNTGSFQIDQAQGYVCGGRDSTPTEINDVDQLDPPTWTAKASILLRRRLLQGGSYEGYGYVSGGVTSGAVDDNEQYDPSANAWASKADIPTARRSHGVEGA